MPTIEKPREDLGHAIKALRHARGLSLSETAERSGVARAAIGAWEAGEHLPSGSALDAVLAALGAEPGVRSRLLAGVAPRYAQEALRLAPLGPPVHVGQLFRAMRLRRGTTQGQTAQVLGVGQAHLARWEAGDLQVPAERRGALLTALDATEFERAAFDSICGEAEPTTLASYRDRIGNFGELPHAIQSIMILGWEADLWRRANGDDAWRDVLCQVVSLRTNLSLMNGNLGDIKSLAARAIGLAESTGQWRLATHAFYADRWRRRSTHGWAAEAQAMAEWASRLPESQELAWTLSCVGLALAHLGQESKATSAMKRSLDMAQRHGVNRDHSGPIDMGEVWLALGDPERALEALGDSRLPDGLHLRALALLKLGEEVPAWLLEAARAELGTKSWFHRRKLAQIEQKVARRKKA